MISSQDLSQVQVSLLHWLAAQRLLSTLGKTTSLSSQKFGLQLFVASLRSCSTQHLESCLFSSAVFSWGNHFSWFSSQTDGGKILRRFSSTRLLAEKHTFSRKVQCFASGLFWTICSLCCSSLCPRNYRDLFEFSDAFHLEKQHFVEDNCFVYTRRDAMVDHVTGFRIVYKRQICKFMSSFLWTNFSGLLGFKIVLTHSNFKIS